MSAKGQKPENFYGNHKAKKMEGLQDPKILSDIENVLVHLAPQDLENFALVSSHFKQIVEKIQSDKTSECLFLLKEIAGSSGKTKKGVLSKVYEMSTSVLLGLKKEKRKQLNVCGPHVHSLDLSLDLETVDDPNPLLKILPYHCPNIDTLILNSCNINVEGIRALSQLARLKTLSLSFCDHLTDDQIEEITKLSGLKELKLNWNLNLPLEPLAALHRLTELEFLDLSHTNISDEELKFIGQLKTLTKLNFDDCGNITDQGIVHLRPLTKLDTINLSSCNISDEGLIDLIELFPKLISVTLRNNHFTDSAAAELSKLKELTHLNLSWSHDIGGSFLESLASLSKLRILNLSRSNHLQTSKIQWKEFKNLMYINLSFTKVDDETLRQMSFMPMIVGASFANAANITLKGVKYLAPLDTVSYLDFSNCGLDNSEVEALFPSSVQIRT